MNAQHEKKTRTERAVEWAVWHFAELAGVFGPLLLAALVTPWFSVASVLVSGAWSVREVLDHRQQARLRADAAQRRQLTAWPTEDTDEQAAAVAGRDESREGA